MFLADLQVAAWPSCERPAQFLESRVAAVGLRTVLRALSALGMMDGAAHSLYPEVIESAVFWRLQRDLLSLSMVGLQHFGYYIPSETSQKPLLYLECSHWKNALKGVKKKKAHHHPP